MSSIQLTLVLIIGVMLALSLLVFGVAKVLRQWSRGRPPLDLTVSLKLGSAPKPHERAKLRKSREV